MLRKKGDLEPLKKQSLFRWEALTAIIVTVSLLTFYIFFLLEFHLKWIAEKTAFESIGTEVNIESIDIDFSAPSILLNRIQVTNPDEPVENSIEISKVQIDFLYAPLLRKSFVAEETHVLGIKFHTKRVKAGKVLPKEKRVLVLKDPSRAKVHDALRGKFNKTAFSDLANLFNKDKRKEIEAKYKDKLKSLKVSEEMKEQSKSIKAKAKSIEASIESPEVKALLAEVKNFKFKSGSTSESVSSAAKVVSLIKKLKEKRSEIKKEVNGLQSEIKELKKQVQEAPAKFLKDSNLLKASLDPGQMSPDKISEEILSEYFSIQLSQVDRVSSSLKKQALGDKAKYIESSTGEGDLKVTAEDSKESHLSLEKEKEEAYRKHGRNIIFHRPSVLPEYWFKKITITSKASEGQDFGDVNGLITDFSASPELLKDPMVVKIKGSVPKQGIGFFKIDSTVDHRLVGEETEKASIEITDYLIKGLELFGGSDEWIKIIETQASTVLDVLLKDGKIDLALTQKLKSPSYDIYAKDKNVERLMKKLQSSNKSLSLSLKAKGEMSSPKLKLSSNIGDIFLLIVKEELREQAGKLAADELSKLSKSAGDTLSPYLKDIDVSSLNAEKLNKIFDIEVEKGLKKLSSSNKTKDLKKDLEKKLLKKLFKKL